VHLENAAQALDPSDAALSAVAEMKRLAENLHRGKISAAHAAATQRYAELLQKRGERRR
jgi:hypothetical protein